MTPRYSERLYVPLRWWAQATMFLATIWLAFIVAIPAGYAWGGSAVLFGLMAWMFISWGRTPVQVTEDRLIAGRAQIERHHLGTAVALDKDATKRALGVNADARAYLLVRPYLSRAVRVPNNDPADPVPYWLIGTRHPRRLAAALNAD